MTWINIAIAAEGRSDYEFLPPLCVRLIDYLMAANCHREYYMPEQSLLIKPIPKTMSSIADAIRAAIDDKSTIFIFHADAGSRSVRRTISSAFDQLWQEFPENERRRFVPLIPVRETEAWILSDIDTLKIVFGFNFEYASTTDPERIHDPKRELNTIFQRMSGTARRSCVDYFARIGEEIDIQRLKTLKSFQLFEQSLHQALECNGYYR